MAVQERKFKILQVTVEFIFNVIFTFINHFDIQIIIEIIVWLLFKYSQIAIFLCCFKRQVATFTF